MTTAIICDGPYPRQGRYGDEVPCWVVFESDDDGEPTGKVYEIGNRQQAIDMGRKMANYRHVEFVNEAGQV